MLELMSVEISRNWICVKFTPQDNVWSYSCVKLNFNKLKWEIIKIEKSVNELFTFR